MSSEDSGRSSPVGGNRKREYDELERAFELKRQKRDLRRGREDLQFACEKEDKLLQIRQKETEERAQHIRVLEQAVANEEHNAEDLQSRLAEMEGNFEAQTKELGSEKQKLSDGKEELETRKEDLKTKLSTLKANQNQLAPEQENLNDNDRPPDQDHSAPEQRILEDNDGLPPDPEQVALGQQTLDSNDGLPSDHEAVANAKIEEHRSTILAKGRKLNLSVEDTARVRHKAADIPADPRGDIPESMKRHPRLSAFGDLNMIRPLDEYVGDVDWFAMERNLAALLACMTGTVRKPCDNCKKAADVNNNSWFSYVHYLGPPYERGMCPLPLSQYA